MSDTPETDATAAIEGNWDTKALRMTAWAKGLERQRDTALAELQELRRDKERLDRLIDLTGEEGGNGFSCTLEWENCSDFPMVKNSDGKIVGEVIPTDEIDGVFEADGTDFDRDFFRRVFRRAIDSMQSDDS